MSVSLGLWVLLVVVNVADYLGTLKWLELGGEETNPLMLAVMRLVKRPGPAMLLAKVPLLGLALYVALGPWEYAPHFLGAMVIVFGAVAGNTILKLRKFARFDR